MINSDDPTVVALLCRLQDLAIEQLAAGVEHEATPTETIEENLAAARRSAARQIASLEEQVRIIDSLLLPK